MNDPIFIILLMMLSSFVAGLSQVLLSKKMKKHFDYNIDPSLLVLPVIFALVGGIMGLIGVVTTPTLGINSYMWRIVDGSIILREIFRVTNFLNFLEFNLLIIIIFCIAYFGIFQFLIGKTNFNKLEKLGQDIPLVARIFSGGIFEEIVFRWGLLSGGWYILSVIFSVPFNLGFWISNLFSAIMFGLIHLPQAVIFSRILEIKKVKAIILSSFLINGFTGLAFGYLFFKFSIEAAMLSHTSIHIVWYLKILIFNRIDEDLVISS